MRTEVPRKGVGLLWSGVSVLSQYLGDAGPVQPGSSCHLELESVTQLIHRAHLGWFLECVFGML